MRCATNSLSPALSDWEGRSLLCPLFCPLSTYRLLHHYDVSCTVIIPFYIHSIHRLSRYPAAVAMAMVALGLPALPVEHDETQWREGHIHCCLSEWKEDASLSADAVFCLSLLCSIPLRVPLCHLSPSSPLHAALSLELLTVMPLELIPSAYRTFRSVPLTVSSSTPFPALPLLLSSILRSHHCLVLLCSSSHSSDVAPRRQHRVVYLLDEEQGEVVVMEELLIDAATPSPVPARSAVESNAVADEDREVEQRRKAEMRRQRKKAQQLQREMTDIVARSLGQRVSDERTTKRSRTISTSSSLPSSSSACASSSLHPLSLPSLPLLDSAPPRPVRSPCPPPSLPLPPSSPLSPLSPPSSNRRLALHLFLVNVVRVRRPLSSDAIRAMSWSVMRQSRQAMGEERWRTVTINSAEMKRWMKPFINEAIRDELSCTNTQQHDSHHKVKQR